MVKEGPGRRNWGSSNLAASFGGQKQETGNVCKVGGARVTYSCGCFFLVFSGSTSRWRGFAEIGGASVNHIHYSRPKVGVSQSGGGTGGGTGLKAPCPLLNAGLSCISPMVVEWKEWENEAKIGVVSLLVCTTQLRALVQSTEKTRNTALFYDQDRTKVTYLLTGLK